MSELRTIDAPTRTEIIPSLSMLYLRVEAQLVGSSFGTEMQRLGKEHLLLLWGCG